MKITETIVWRFMTYFIKAVFGGRHFVSFFSDQIHNQKCSSVGSAFVLKTARDHCIY